MLADCHTHLDQYPRADLEGVISRARNSGVAAIIVAGTTISTSARCVALAQENSTLFAGVGIHPTEIQKPVDEACYLQLRNLACSSPRVVTISEIGLDFGPNSPELSIQYQAFREQIRLAREVHLPIIFHSREPVGRPEAHLETLRVLREERAWEVGGVMHYFQADSGIAKECLDLGFSISLAKPLLKMPHLQELAKELPLESIILETDSYPQFFKTKRSNWTEPKDVLLVAQQLANLKSIELEEVTEVTNQNLLSMYASPRVHQTRSLLSNALKNPWPARPFSNRNQINRGQDQAPALQKSP